MQRFTCSEKLSKKEPNKSNKAIIAMLLAGTVTVASIAGLTFGKIRDSITHSDIVKGNQVETNLANNSQSGPVFSNFMNENLEDFENIKNDLIKYKELYNISSRSDKAEAEMQALMEKINTTHSKTIKKLALYTVKSKIADAHKLNNIDDIKITVNTEERIFNVSEKKHIIPLHVFKNDDSQLAKTVFRLANIQNKPLESKLDKTQNANLLYGLFNDTIKTANKTYLVKDNELIEIDNLNKINKKQKDHEEER